MRANGVQAKQMDARKLGGFHLLCLSPLCPHRGAQLGRPAMREVVVGMEAAIPKRPEPSLPGGTTGSVG